MNTEQKLIDANDFSWPIGESKVDLGPEVANALNEFVRGVEIDLEPDGSGCFCHDEPGHDKYKNVPVLVISERRENDGVSFGEEWFKIVRLDDVVRRKVQFCLEIEDLEAPLALAAALRSLAAECEDIVREAG